MLPQESPRALAVFGDHRCDSNILTLDSIQPSRLSCLRLFSNSQVSSQVRKIAFLCEPEQAPLCFRTERCQMQPLWGGGRQLLFPVENVPWRRWPCIPAHRTQPPFSLQISQKVKLIHSFTHSFSCPLSID